MQLSLVAALAGCVEDGLESAPPAGGVVEPVPVDPSDRGPAFPDPPPVDELACVTTDNALRLYCGITLPGEPEALTLSWQRRDGEGPVRTRASDLASEHVALVSLLEFDTPYVVTARTPSRTWQTDFVTPSPPFEVLDSRLAVTGASTVGLIGADVPCGNEAVAVVYDTGTGGLVWYQNLDPRGTLGLLHLVRFTDRGTVVGETGGQIVEVDRSGADLVRFDTDYPGVFGLNHDIFDWNGLFVSQYQEDRGGLILDNIVAIDATGLEVYEWRPAVHLDIPADAFGDWLHSNSQFVDDDGALYLSWLTPSAIAKVGGEPGRPAWGTPEWIMTGDGQAGTVGNDITVDWGAFSPPRFGNQHNAHVRHDGRLMFLDNLHGRGIVMTVDEQARIATVDATYETRENGCLAQGTAMDTLDGNAVVACASRWVREYDGGTSELVWEAQVASCANGGRSRVARWYPLDHWE